MNVEAMADKAATLHGRSVALWHECAGVVLEAKREAKRGEWGKFLKLAGISERTAGTP